MSAVNRTTLQGYFNVGDKPTAANFLDLIDSNLNLTDGGTVAGATTFTGAVTTASVTKGLVSITATDAITAAEHAGRTIVLNAADAASTAVVCTLPAATGTGNVYNFIIGVVSAAAGMYVIQVVGDDTIDGQVHIGIDDGASKSFKTAATSDTITLNGTTKGGVSIGDTITLTDIAADQWAVGGLLVGSGTIVTPFSAAVS